MLFLSSCKKRLEPHFPVYYNIENKADFDIRVVYTFNNPIGPGPLPDSVIHIQAGRTRTLFVSMYKQYNRSNPEKADTLKSIKTVFIFRNDSIASKKNYRLTQYWEYSLVNESEGELKLSVSPDDFSEQKSY